jgi:hypothetical protein
MGDVVFDLAEQRLIRRAPEHPLPLGEDDQRYVRTCLADIEAAFAVEALPQLPLASLPGKLLMRRLIELRRTLRPGTEDQRSTHGRLSNAILLLDTACALDEDLAAAHTPHRPKDPG